MPLKDRRPKAWPCDCNPRVGGHIVDGRYTCCVHCQRHRADLAKIVVPSGMGGVFRVEILDVTDTGCLVRNRGNSDDRDQRPPYRVAFESIEPRWKDTGRGRATRP